MSDRIYLNEELLRPVSPEQPAGRDLCFEPIFQQIRDWRRDDEITGKAAEWPSVANACLDSLALSKDLRLCCFLTEAAIHLDGFGGLRDCLRLTREVMDRFWDKGLYPLIEDGDLEYRSGPLGWFNDRMPDVIRLVPITARDGGGENYSFARYLQAQRIGTEDSIQKQPGENREAIAGLRQQGWITMDAFESAMRSTRKATFESLYTEFDEAHQQMKALTKAIDERFGDVAPRFSDIRSLFEDLDFLLASTLKKKRDEEPAAAAAAVANGGPVGTVSQNQAQGFWTAGMPVDSVGAWQDAEALVKSGSVDRGLQLMAALAAQESSGRARFMRKLMLVDVCRTSGRERLARTVLEELQQQISDYKLDVWESSALVGAVWSRLYRIYNKSDSSNDQEQATVLYNQLCRLDPWQAYVDCED